LVAARKAAGFTQEALAARLGVERSTVYRWESGETDPLPMFRPDLAKLLRVDDERLSALLGEPVDHAAPTATLSWHSGWEPRGAKYPESLAAIIDRAELDDIVCYGLTAQSAAGYPLPPFKADSDAATDMVIRARLRPDELTVRVVVRVRTTHAALKVDLGADRIPDILDDSAQDLVRFIADSAISTIYPFVRELIADVSRRVGVDYVIAMRALSHRGFRMRS